MASSSSGSGQTATYYYAGWHMVPCLYSQEVKLEEVLVNEKQVFGGTVEGQTSFQIDKPSAFGGPKKEGGVVGEFEYRDGDATQSPSPYLQNVLGASDTPAYRGVVSIIARKPYLQANNPYLFPYKFKMHSWHGTWELGLRKIINEVTTYTTQDNTPTTNYNDNPEAAACNYAEWNAGDCVIEGYPYPADFPNGAILDDPESWVCTATGGTSDGSSGDVCTSYKFVGDGSGPVQAPTLEKVATTDNVVLGHNGVHIVREALTNKDWGLGLDAAESIDDADFLIAAQTIYDEKLAVSLSWDFQTSISDFLQVIMDHIGGILSQRPGTEKYVLTLIRDGQSPELSIEEGNILSFDEYEEKGWAGVTNEITVTYTDIVDGKKKSVTVHDLAAIERQGGTIAETRDYPGLPTLTLAEKIANRDLAIITSAGAKIKITTDRIAANLTVGRNFELTWPEYGLDKVVFRAVDIDYGQQDKNQIRISAISDAPVSSIFQTPSAISDNPTTSDPFTEPVNVNPRAVYEAPYWHVAKSIASTGFPEMPGDIDSFLIALGCKPQSVATHFSSQFQRNAEAEAIGSNGGWAGSVLTLFSLSEFDTLIALDRTYYNNLSKFVAGQLAVLGGVEIVEVVSLDVNNWRLVVNRGMLDTVPREHLGAQMINTLGYIDVAFSYDTWLPGDLCTAWLRTVTNTGILEVSDTQQLDLTVAGSRQGRPLPVGNLQIGGEYLGAIFLDDFSISWANRNRLTQTTNDHVSQDDGNVIPEDGTEFQIDIYGDDDTLIHSETLEAVQVNDPTSQLSLYEHDAAANITGTWPKTLFTDSSDTSTGAGFVTTAAYASAFETKLSGTFTFSGARHNVYPTMIGLVPSGFTRESLYGSPETIIGMAFGDSTDTGFRSYKIGTDLDGVVGQEISSTLQDGTTYPFELTFDWLNNLVTMSMGGVVRVSGAAIPAGHQALKGSFQVAIHFPNYESVGAVIVDDIVLTSDGVEEFSYSKSDDPADYTYPTSYTYPIADEIADTGTGSPNDRLRFILSTVRDGLSSWTSWERICFRASSMAEIVITNPNFSTGDLTGWDVVDGDVVARPVAGMPFGTAPACGASDFVMGNRAGSEALPWTVSQAIDLSEYTSQDSLDNGLTVLKFEIWRQAISYNVVGEFKVDYYTSDGTYVDTEVGSTSYFPVGDWLNLTFYSSNPPGAKYAKLTISTLSNGVSNDGYISCVKATIYGRLGATVNLTAAAASAAVMNTLIAEASSDLTAMSVNSVISGHGLEVAATKLSGLTVSVCASLIHPPKASLGQVMAATANIPARASLSSLSALINTVPARASSAQLVAIVSV